MKVRGCIILFVTLKITGQCLARARKATTIPPATTTKFVITRQLYGNFTPQMQSYPIKDRETKVQLEGVDYDLMPPEMYERNHDCRANYHVCIRYSSIISPVCGYDWYSGYFDDYHTPCEIDLLNCHYKLTRGWGQYGIHYMNNYIYYNGEGHTCEYYVRMGGNMMDAYFGENARRNAEFNQYYQTIRNLPYRVNVTETGGRQLTLSNVIV
ncbi:hypothetical protein evm_005750 [Chilo suppressalis]|nr:hypothetical protein evm_005750 [Chilo suppressalis]